ncbi:UvrB/UvrC motif-containing protein [Sediminibacillus albus]|uniref:Protein arginine kinase activator n=1 Tax=Sediminibacillus albus TaxID=407036 RepID=A0A1G9D566_9BACI|nr:UvrB/UvrC motif-containing protein [Sediminibacillus albus]SDK58834.1 protein arginine kinase activator [Sediminibacillus albus]
MECQECHERPATLHFSKIVNGNKTEVHVCEYCAKEKGYMGYDDEAYSLHNLLSGLFKFESTGFSDQQANIPAQQELQCPKCGMNYQEFARVGKFGCAQCYQTFSDKLNPIFRRVHSGNTNHHGKIPTRIGSSIHQKKQLFEYREQLKQLISNEEFEQAAKVRDHIRQLEQDLHHDRDGEEE